MDLYKSLISLVAIVCFSVSLSWAEQQNVQEEQIKPYIDMLRKDIRSERNTIVDQAMALEPAGKAKFWGIYDSYAKEVKGLWDQRLANIKKYSEHYGQMTDDIADDLATKALDLQSQRLDIQKKYFSQIKAALGARVAGRFLQVETMLDDILDIQIGSEIPLIP
jgi:hypothetical protein